MPIHARTGEEIITEEVVDLIDELVICQKLMIFNDHVNTFDHVIDSLMDVCHHSALQAEQCALIIHYNGKASVREGAFDELYPMKTALNKRGLDAVIE